MASCPDSILRLIDRFHQQADQVRSPDYNETLIRIDFINPLMSALGWDIDNGQGFAEQYREVVHEDRVKVAGQTKAPDYSFRIGGVRKFFLEAKKPAVKIKTDCEPAYQLRRYAWSAKLPCSLLTDFEELAIYDTRIQPKRFDSPSVARREFIAYTQYPDRWDFLVGTFSKDAVLRGEYDRYCQTKKGRGAQPFDDAFLAEIEEWRKSLATNIALRNGDLDQGALNFAVQRIIDRIIFLRIAEDRGTETVGQLQALLNGDQVFSRLSAIFRRADDRYNSGLFHFCREKDRDENPDTITPSLEIDDTTLKNILRALYYPDSPYEFTMVSADILGSIYERFLGKVISLTPAHRARVDDKPEVRKAGGVYYTPTYIVDYIVKNTVGKLLGASDEATERRSDEGPAAPSPGTPGEGRGGGPPAAPRPRLKILDPACGSGSFLIGAYQFLLDWYLDYYTRTDPMRFATGKNPVLRPAGISPGAGGLSAQTPSFRLTIAERKRILLDHIHGVDLDSQAVEVTKLNLLLKCLEGETSQTLGFEQRLFRERALPDLGKNIICGNSLIGTDIIGTEAWNAMSEDERRRVNPFDYERAFPQVFKRRSPSPGTPGEGRGEGGFDAVIGNPPYVVLNEVEAPLPAIKYLTNFSVASYKGDLFHLFIERGVSLLKNGGQFGYIVPNPWLTQQFTKPLRQFVLRNTLVRDLVVLDYEVFAEADVYTAMVILEKGIPDLHTPANVRIAQNSELNRTVAYIVPQGTWSQDPEQRIEYRQHGPGGDLVRRIQSRFPQLHEIAKASLGCQAYNSSKHTDQEIKARIFHAERKLSEEYMPELAGSDVGRYQVSRRKGEWIRYGSWLHDYRPLEMLTGPRVLLREITGAPPHAIHACYLCETYCHYKTILNVNPNENTKVGMQYICGILNSRLLTFILQRTSNKKNAQAFPRLSVGDLKRLPIPGTPAAILHDGLVSLVSSMLSLHKRLAAEKLPHCRDQIQREIDATDRQIDQLVYQLYGLTDDEIRIVEEATR